MKQQWNVFTVIEQIIIVSIAQRNVAIFKFNENEG